MTLDVELLSATEAPTEGKEYSLVDDPDGWKRLIPAVGWVLELSFRASNILCFEDAWAAILIDEVTRGEDGVFLIQGRFLGCEEFTGRDTALVGIPSDQVKVHLCGDEICPLEEIAHLHTQRIRLWPVEKFDATYISPEGVVILDEIRKGLVAKDKSRREPAGRTKKPTAKADAQGKQAAIPKRSSRSTGKTPSGGAKTARRKVEELAVAEGAPPDTEADGTSALEGGGQGDTSQGKREFLRDRLGALRARVRGRRPGSTGGKLAGGTNCAQGPGKMTTSLNLSPSTPVLALPAGPEVPSGSTSKRLKRTRSPTKESTSTLLLAKAAQHEEDRRQAKKKKAAKDSKTRLAKMLVSVLSGRDKKKKKKKRKKRTRTGGSGGGSGGGSSGNGSQSSSSSSGSGSDSHSRKGGFGSDGESDDSMSMEAPLRKRSLEKPGSVMQLLVRQAAHHLDQAAVLEEQDGDSTIVSGVRIASYFSLMIRPFHSASHPMVRELFSLAQVIDCLRGGRLAQAPTAWPPDS